MSMNEDAVRALVRESIAKHLGVREPEPSGAAATLLHLTSHASHFRYALPESGGPCLIEPGVACNHCGYCQSHGH
ncbi:MAG TPA: hypothetical protein VFX12_02740 [Vicinamibacterales bacterium]|nr:hypothetical protein [Vicinamibacterales bacterium]